MDDVTEEIQVTNDPKLVQIEETLGELLCQVAEKQSLRLGGVWFRSLPEVLFGLRLKQESTQEEAEALAEMLNKTCDGMYGLFYSGSLTDEYPELNEFGWAKPVSEKFGSE